MKQLIHVLIVENFAAHYWFEAVYYDCNLRLLSSQPLRRFVLLPGDSRSLSLPKI